MGLANSRWERETKRAMGKRDRTGTWQEADETHLGASSFSTVFQLPREIILLSNYPVYFNEFEFTVRRLNQDKNGGAWCPKWPVTSDSSEWIEINLHKVHVITATGTQGRFGNSQGVEYSEAYVLEYWRAALGKWVRYRNVHGEEVRKGMRILSNTSFNSLRRLPKYFESTHDRNYCLRKILIKSINKKGLL